MKSKNVPWTNQELKTYILLLSANIDSDRTKEERKLIKSNIDPKIYKKIKNEFSGDTEEENLKKIEDKLQMHEIFNSDKNFKLTKINLDRI